MGVVMLGSTDPMCCNTAFIRKFCHLGLEREEELQAFLLLVKAGGRIACGEDVVRVGGLSSYSTILLSGVACRYRMTENGRRQILTFQYPGDFCDVDRYLLRGPDDAVAALTDCSIGIIRHQDIERIIAQYPKFGQALWQATIKEAYILRERLLNVSQRPALARVANLLCEQIVRLEAIGANSAIIPMTQIDLADAASLSPVHMNRIIQDLRKLGILSKHGRCIEVASRERLMDIGQFDGRYLGIPDGASEDQAMASSVEGAPAQSANASRLVANGEPTAYRQELYGRQHRLRRAERLLLQARSSTDDSLHR